MKYYNNDERFGDAGPFVAENKTELSDAMKPMFSVWAEERWSEFCEGDQSDHDTFIAGEMALMKAEFEDALEEVV